MSRINVHSSSARRGFTLVEILVATSLSAIVFAGILAAYLFVGRSLTRLVNFQQQEVESRRALRLVSEDVSAAISLSTATTSQLVMTRRISGLPASVTYTYSSGAQTLTRTDSAGARTLLNGLTTFTISYFNKSGTAVTGSPQSVKGVEFSYTSAAGSAASGTRASYTTVSPRILMRNSEQVARP